MFKPKIYCMLVVLIVVQASAVTIQDFAYEWLVGDSYCDVNEDGYVDYLDFTLIEFEKYMDNREVTIWLHADNQISDKADDPNWSRENSPVEYRRHTTGAQREQESIDDAIIELPDVFIYLGDDIDLNTSPSQKRPLLQASVTRTLALPMPVLRTQGNHDAVAFLGQAVNYYTDIDVNHAVRENVFTNAIGWKSYTYDVKGIRLVVLNTQSEVSGDEITWFETQLNASPLPVVVIGHYPMWLGEFSWAYTSSYIELQEKINAAGNVLVILAGHYHHNKINTKLKDILYMNFPGSVLAPKESDNAYFKLSIRPNAISTPNGMKANIAVKGFGSLGIPKTRDFTNYFLAGN